MALHWSWAFGSETTEDLNAMGWTVTNDDRFMAITTDTDKVYTYTGSPTRYGWIFDGNYGYMTAPTAAVSGLSKGWIAAPWKSTVNTGFYNNQPLLWIAGSTSGEVIGAYVSGTGAINLYVSNTFKESSAAIDWTSWKYVALKWDMSANPWSGQVYVDGVAVTSLATQSDDAETAGSARYGGWGVFNSPSVFSSQLVVWSDTADAGETPYFVTRAEPISDGTNVGTWTPSTGTDDFAVVDSPFDASTYTQDLLPVASNRCEVVTSSIATAVGVTPATIAGVTAHTYSEGQAITAKAVVSISGGTEANGDTTTISASTTSYAYATDTAAYSGTDTIDVIYEVVST